MLGAVGCVIPEAFNKFGANCGPEAVWFKTSALLLDGNTLNYFGKPIPINLVVAEVVLLGGAEYYIIINGLTIESNASLLPSLRDSVGVMPSEDHTSIELTRTDRPGLLSEVCAVLIDLNCSVVNAEIWTHNSRAAVVVHVTDYSTGRAVNDPKRLLTIKKLLCYVLKGDSDSQAAQMRLSPPESTHRGRRLHQIMFNDRDYERMETVGYPLVWC